jgi:hypothetical protein
MNSNYDLPTPILRHLLRCKSLETERLPADLRLASGASLKLVSRNLNSFEYIWEWACNDHDGDPDVVMACAGDVPTLETLAAVDLLR